MNATEDIDNKNYESSEISEIEVLDEGAIDKNFIVPDKETVNKQHQKTI